jgi:allantoin racemase
MVKQLLLVPADSDWRAYMGVRLVGLHLVAAEEGTAEGRLFTRVGNFERNRMKQVADPSTEIVMRFPTWGTHGVDPFYCSLTNCLSQGMIVPQVINAEKEGFDAALLICCTDPLLSQIRTAVDIPVIGMAEAAMHMANMMGAKFGFITFTKQTAYDTEMMIDKYGLRQKCVGVATMPELEANWLPETLKKPPSTVQRTIDHITVPARELISKGAEVLVLGCGLTNAWLGSIKTLEILTDKYPNGFWEIDGVPLIDTYGCVVKIGELFAQWKQQGRPFISRAGAYSKVSDIALDLGKDTLGAFGSGYWDC